MIPEMLSVPPQKRSMSIATPPSDSNFSTEHLSGDLKRLSVRGGIYMFGGQSAKFILQLASTMVLARILMPKDFGLIAMVTVLTGFLYMFNDLGLSMATVQKSEIRHDQISTLFWINVSISFIFMLLTMALAPAIAWFYQEPKLLRIMVALSPAFLLGGLTAQHHALLKRQMRFTALFTINIVSIFASAATGISCGFAGLGYWSLVLMQLVPPLLMVIGVWIACEWRPGLPARGTGVRAMLSFGGYQTLSNLIAFFTRNIDTVLIGYFYNSYLTGLYSKAFSLCLLPAEQIAGPMMSVALPALSRLQNDPKRYREYYTNAVKALAYTTMPFAAMMGALSDQIVLLILGDQWIRSGFIFRILAFAAFWIPITQTVIWIYLSLGQTRRMTHWFSMACPITISALLIGLPWGPEGVAIGYAIVTWLLVYPIFGYSLKYAPVKVRDVFLMIRRPFVVSALLYLSMFATQSYLRNSGVIVAIAGALSVGIGVLLLITALSGSLRAEIYYYICIARSALFGTQSKVAANKD